MEWFSPREKKVRKTICTIKPCPHLPAPNVEGRAFSLVMVKEKCFWGIRLVAGFDPFHSGRSVAPGAGI
jgi:hypothetical protein